MSQAISQPTRLPQVATPAGAQAAPQNGATPANPASASGKTPASGKGGFLPQLAGGQGAAEASSKTPNKGKDPKKDAKKDGPVVGRRPYGKPAGVGDLFKLKRHDYVEVQKQEESLHQYYRKYFEGKVARQRGLGAESVFTVDAAESRKEYRKESWTKAAHVSVDAARSGQASNNRSGLGQISQPPPHISGSLRSAKREQDEKSKYLTTVGQSLDRLNTEAYHEATSIMKSGRQTLYSTIVTNNERYYKIAKQDATEPSPRSGIGISADIADPSHRQQRSPRASPAASSRPSLLVSKNVCWGKRGALSSNRHLWPQTSNFKATLKKEEDASNVYLPLSLRHKDHTYQKQKGQLLGPKGGRQDGERGHYTQRPVNTLGAAIARLRGDGPLADRSSKTTPVSALSHSSATGRPTLEAAIDGDAVNQAVRFQDSFASPSPSQSSPDKARTQRVGRKTYAIDGKMGYGMDSSIDDATAHKDSLYQTLPDASSRKGRGIMKRKDTKRQSFSLCQTKYGDARNLRHPLKEAKGPILNDQATIAKMKTAKRYPIPEKLLHKPLNFDLYIDSLMHSAYNSDENEAQASLKQEIDAPCNSMESFEEIDFFSSSSEGEPARGAGVQADDVLNALPGALKSLNEQSSKKQLSSVGGHESAEKSPARKKAAARHMQTPAELDKYTSKEAWEHHKKMKKLKLHQDAPDLHGFDMELLLEYPHDVRPGDVPVFLLKDQKKKMAGYPDLWKKLQAEFDRPHLLPTRDHIQLVYEGFCKQFKCNPLTILQYFHHGVMSYENYVLEMEQLKAICCTIPLLSGLKHIKFINNQLTDEMTAILLMAAFMNPCLEAITINGNCLQKNSCRTMRLLQVNCPSKIKRLDLSGAAGISYHVESIISDMGNLEFVRTQTFRPGQGIRELCLSNIPLAYGSCRHIGDILANTDNIKQLDLQSCKISGGGTRFIMDALTRNVGLQFLNLSHNSMVSKIYEFSIKLAKVVCGHEEIMHIDLTNTGLRQEEVLFIGMTLPLSKSCIGMHLSANNLGYYERIFLRTLIDAKVQQHFKNVAQVRKPTKKKTEASQMLEMSQQDFLEEELHNFINTFNHLERNKMNLNEQIASVLKDADVVRMFREIREGKGTSATAEQQERGADSRSAIHSLIEKINARQAAIESQRRDAERFHDLNVDVQDPGVLADFKTIGLYTKKDLPLVHSDTKRDSLSNGRGGSTAAVDAPEKEQADRALDPSAGATGPPGDASSRQGGATAAAEDNAEKQADSQGQSNAALPPPDDDKSVEPTNEHLKQTDFSALYEDQWLLQNTLKIDRIRQRVQLDALKHLKGKSAAEIAMMFIGINKIAYDVLMDNPMTGYMSQVIFTRILGQDEIEDGPIWRDCNQCWICEKWKKQSVTYLREDMNTMRQNIQKLHELDEVLEKCADVQNQHLLQRVSVEEARKQCDLERQESKRLDERAPRRELNTIEVTKSSLAKMAKAAAEEGKPSPATRSEDELATESFMSEADLEAQGKQPTAEQAFDPICPIPFDRSRAQKLLPRNHLHVQSIDIDGNAPGQFDDSSESSVEAYEQLFSEHGQPSPYGQHSRPYQPPRSKPRFDRKQVAGTINTPMALTKSSFHDSKYQNSTFHEASYGHKLQKFSDQEPEHHAQLHPPRFPGQAGPFGNAAIGMYDGRALAEQGFHSRDSTEPAFLGSEGAGMGQFAASAGRRHPSNRVTNPEYQHVDFAQSNYNNPLAREKHALVQPAEDLEPNAAIRRINELNRHRQKNKKFINEEGKLVRAVQKQVMFRGAPYTLEEEIPVNSDESSSLETSDDDFEEDTAGVMSQFHKKIVTKLKARTKEEKEEAMKLQKLLDKNVPKTVSLFNRKQVFICASFNDWVPVEMKTAHEIKLERQKGDRLQSYLLDEGPDAFRSPKDHLNVLQYSSIVPPGRHFFYYVFDRRMICLSASQPIVRFKDSNVFLNEIVVTQRTEPIQNVKLLKHSEDDGTEEFQMARSVFKTFQEEDAEMLDRMWKQDLKYGKIAQIPNRHQNAQKLMEVLTKHYQKLKNMFTFAIANSKQFPKLNLDDATRICYKAKLFDRNMNMATFDKNFVATNASINGVKNPSDRELNRYEFIELMVRTAKSKYLEPKVHHELYECMERLIEKDLVPNVPQVDGAEFRKAHAYNSIVNMLLFKNHIVLRRLYEGVGVPAPPLKHEKNGEAAAAASKKKKKDDKTAKALPPTKLPLDDLGLDFDQAAAQANLQVTMEAIRSLCKRANLNIEDAKVNLCFVESMQSRVDTMKEPGMANQMKYVEFLQFICRLSHELYAGTKEEKELELYEKIENVLEPLLATANVKRIFSYSEKLKRDAEEAAALAAERREIEEQEAGGPTEPTGEEDRTSRAGSESRP